MPVTPLGNTIYINQNMNVVANKQADMQNRFDLQSLAAMTLKEDEDKEVVQVRPTEETYKIDPQHQHEKSQSDQRESVFEGEEEPNGESSVAQDDDESEIISQDRILDIKI
ncbi:hypothetical protein [Campylobacter sp. CCUG 57310]|uniref:hypothetical protein n=1 Tax=Campylobacter sp. CCUG 57310 TaxID=2517362 RepID=UPI001C209C55|nr:hypothetical protein [Campylobacter sp. CCUG 57310]QKF91388.1 hypothetical protein CORI_0152 [Campylobacter sp. CCUG 57310]